MTTALLLGAGAILFLLLALAATGKVAILVFALCAGVFTGGVIGIPHMHGCSMNALILMLTVFLLAVVAMQFIWGI